MEETISLRELIETIIKRKWLIVIMTTICLVIAAVFSYVVATPTYEAKATILINSIQQKENTPIDQYLNEVVSPSVFTERLKAPQLLEKVIKKSQLQDTTVKNLQDRLTFENEKDSNIIAISFKGQDPVQTKEILNTLLKEAQIYIGETVNQRLQSLAEQYKEQAEIEKVNLDEVVKEYNELRVADGLPSIVILEAVAGGNQFILNIDDEKLNELNHMDRTKQVEFEKMNNKINKLTNLYNGYYNNYEEARSLARLYKVDNKISVLSDAAVPTSPISPRPLLNIAISIVIGLMLSVGIAFFREYWRTSAEESTMTNK